MLLWMVRDDYIRVARAEDQTIFGCPLFITDDNFRAESIMSSRDQHRHSRFRRRCAHCPDLCWHVRKPAMVGTTTPSVSGVPVHHRTLPSGEAWQTPEVMHDNKSTRRLGTGLMAMFEASSWLVGGSKASPCLRNRSIADRGGLTLQTCGSIICYRNQLLRILITS